MFFSIEVAILIVIQISILALLGKRFSIRMNKGQIDISWEKRI